MSKPLIKWPGGKGSEISRFLPLLPEYDRYIEPFVGGGALYFHLEPENAVINDISEGLMEFYQLVQDQDERFFDLLHQFCDSFEGLKEACRVSSGNLEDLFWLYAAAEERGADIRALAPHLHLSVKVGCANEALMRLVPDREEYKRILAAAVEDKYIRTAGNYRKKPFSEEDLQENLLTAFTGGFYLYFRKVWNDIVSGRMTASRQYRASAFYFVREYCYGAMFRYNRDGDFNIPYGGMTYNKKDFRGKIERLSQPETAALLKRTRLFCEDFEQLTRQLDLNERDFLFLDPPYDTEFSEYEKNAFGREDHRRLADFLKNTRAKFLLVIKNTDYIYSLYEGHFYIRRFDNQYSYNVRSRNDRKAEHLIIMNYPCGPVI